MLDGLRQFIAEVVSPTAQERAFDDTGYRLAATALLIHVIRSTGSRPSLKSASFTACWRAALDLIPAPRIA